MCANFFHDVFDIQKYCILSSDESIIPMTSAFGETFKECLYPNVI